MHRGAPELAAGDVVVWRDIFRARIAFARPMRVVSVQDGLLVCSLRAGTPCKMHSTYATGDRDGYVAALATGDWSLVDHEWRSTDVLYILTPGTWYACCLFFDAETHRFLHWYINFQEPVRASSQHIDTFDLCLDIVVDKDHTWRWKDRQEFDLAIELGVISQPMQQQVMSAAAEVIDRIEARAAPLDGSWTDWQPPAHEAPPTLLANWTLGTG